MRFFRLFVLLLTLGITSPPAFAFGFISPSEDYLAEAAIMSASTTAAKVRQIKKVPSVGVLSLNVPYFEGGMSYADFRILASKYSSGIGRLQSALYRNSATRNELAKRGIPIDQIVGVRVSSNGSLRIYILE